MNILFTVATYYPKKDGVAVVTTYLAEGLVKKGFNVSVITSDQGSLESEEIINGVKVIRVKLYSKYGLYFGRKKEYKNLIDKMATKCDVLINVNTQQAFTDLIINNLKNYKCKKILYLHSIFDFRFHTVDFLSINSFFVKIIKWFRWKIHYLVNGRKYKNYDQVIQLHEKDIGTTYFKKKFNIESIVIENAADDAFFDKKKNDKFHKPYDRYIINVSNYNKRKNQKLAIDEFLKSKIDKRIGLVLIGSKKNNYYDYLEKYIEKKKKKLNINRDDKPILMLYDIERNKIPSYVSNSYLYLMTSTWEAFPISLVESMACGIPFISTDVGIVKYLFGGIVSKKNDLHYWIEKLFDNKDVRDDIGRIGYNYASKKLKKENKINELSEIIKAVNR